MTELERIAAISSIQQLKAQYFRGLDTRQPSLVRDILAADCVLDYSGCFVDPATGVDLMPEYNGHVVRGRDAWGSSDLASSGVVTVHHGYTAEIEVATETTARAVWAMTDRLFLPAGRPITVITGYGHYHETYERLADRWLLKTLRLTRLRVEAN